MSFPVCRSPEVAREALFEWKNREPHDEAWDRAGFHPYARRPNFLSSSGYPIWISVGRPCGQQ